jgi:hypothetical protein
VQERLFIGVVGFIVWVVAFGIVNAARQSRFEKLFFDVNAQLPPEKRFSYFGWHGIKYKRLLSQYRAFGRSD